VKELASSRSVTTVLSNTVLRYGIFERFEVSGLLNWQNDHIQSPLEDFYQGGISATQLGFRYNITKRKGAIPAIGVQYRLLLKAQSDTYKRSHYGSRLVIITANRLLEKVGLVTNWG